MILKLTTIGAAAAINGAACLTSEVNEYPERVGV